MPDDVLKTLLECGVHFGHQTRRWNPKMKRFIFGERSGIYIIDLEKTKECLEIACDFAYSIAAKGGNILFVGTKKQAKDVIASEAVRAGVSYINNRWMGGLLTNFETVKKSLDKLKRIEKMFEDGTVENLKKKETVKLDKDKVKMMRDLGGIRDMRELPKALFIVDSKREEIAVKEACKLGIPIIGLIDTNCDPEVINYPVPGNDDALKAIRYITVALADKIVQGKKDYQEAETVRRKSQPQPEKHKSAEKGPGMPAEAAKEEETTGSAQENNESEEETEKLETE